MTDQLLEVERVKALAVFTYRMSAMIELGFNLGTIMQTLSEAAPPPYDEFCRPINDRWRQIGNEYLGLATIMDERPDLFPPFYVGMQRCCEIGGAWQIFYDLAQMLEETMRMWVARGRPAEWMRLLLSPDTRQPHDWSELDTGRRKLILYLFCKSFGMMLGSGVPLALAGETAACFLPKKQRDGFRADMAEFTVRRNEQMCSWLASAVYADAFLLKMIHDGETCGTLDVVMEKAASLYQRELELESA